jgi:hypothetical protein
VPSTDAQLLRAKLIRTAQKLVTASKVAKAHSSKQRVQIGSSEAAAAVEASSEQQQQQQQHDQEQQGEQQQAAAAAESTSSEEQQERLTVGQQAMMQFEHLMAAAGHDSYGTTQQSPAEIAQQIADSNRRTAGGRDGSDGEGGRLLQKAFVCSISDCCHPVVIAQRCQSWCVRCMFCLCDSYHYLLYALVALLPCSLHCREVGEVRAMVIMTTA